MPVLIEFVRDEPLGHGQRPKPIGGVLLDVHLRILEGGVRTVVQPIENRGLCSLCATGEGVRVCPGYGSGWRGVLYQ